ncbi:MAG: DNA-binding protein [Phycisphaerae bacterium]
MGGGQADKATLAVAGELGALIAGRGWVLLNGGRNAGVMAASAAGARAAGGLVVGVLGGANPAQASPDLDVAICTGLGDGRNLINVLSANVIIACRGGAGTLSEVALALKNDKPVILLDFDPGPAVEPYRHRGLLHTATSADDAVQKAASLLEPAS